MDNGFPITGLRLNLIGREPHGLLRPGAEADAFCEQLKRDLLELRDADTGLPMIRDVLRVADLYRSEYPTTCQIWLSNGTTVTGSVRQVAATRAAAACASVAEDRRRRGRQLLRAYRRPPARRHVHGLGRRYPFWPA